MTETINGVRRELYETKYQRVMRFYGGITNSLAVFIQQHVETADVIWGCPSFVASSKNVESTSEASIYSEAVRQAVELMNNWAEDTGKEIES